MIYFFLIFFHPALSVFFFFNFFFLLAAIRGRPWIFAYTDTQPFLGRLIWC